MPKTNFSSGTYAIFDSDDAVLKAAHATYKAGFRKFDSVTPFPVHGMDDAMGLKPSWIPYVTFLAGLLGMATALGTMGWINVFNWPLIIGGKPHFGLPAFIPITFELTVLFGGLFSVGALFYVCGLPRINPPILDPDLTSHKFAIFIPSNDFGYEAARVETFLKGLGAQEVKRVEQY
jgi:predicted membrane channel-forming protein YqfA (hemolysin III family)